MSARDAESGSSTYKGGSGRAGGLGNGGIGGGMGGGGNWGGGMGGGAGRNGGMNSRTGLTTGNNMFGGMAFGRPGGMAMNPGAFGMRPQAAVQQQALNRPARSGLLGNPTPASLPGVNPVPETPPNPIMSMANYMPDFMNPIEGPNFFNSYKAPPAPEPTTPFGPRQNYYGGWPSMVANNNPYNDPRFGMPSGIQANGLGQAGTGANFGGPNGMRQW